jgi:hypothetical protein
MTTFRSIAGAAFLVVAGGSCGAGSAELASAKGAAYEGSFEEVWQGLQDALATEFPMVQELDAQHHRILTCWHSIDRKMDIVTAGDLNADRIFYRAAVQLSEAPPWRVTVSGRAAHFTQPSIFPYPHGDASEPAWVEGRTERLTLQINKALKPAAAAAPGAPPPAYDPGDQQNIVATCVVGDVTGIPVEHTTSIRISKDNAR